MRVRPLFSFLAPVACLLLALAGCKQDKPMSKEYQNGPPVDYMKKTYQNVPKGR